MICSGRKGRFSLSDIINVNRKLRFTKHALITMFNAIFITIDFSLMGISPLIPDLCKALVTQLTLFCWRTEYLACAIKFSRSLITLVNVRKARLTKGIRRRKVTLAVLMQQLGILAAVKSCRILDIAINCISICLNKHQHEACIPHTSFDFEGSYSTMDQFRNMLVHEHIFSCQRIFRRIDVAVFFYMIVPTAWLQTSPPVAAHTEHHRADVAIGSMSRAHISMDEIFKLHTCNSLQMPRRHQIHFP
ncbi:hypothetical protein D3C73_831000 [compost metagenome]